MIGLEPIIQRLATERAPSKRRQARPPATGQTSGDKPFFWPAGCDRLGARLGILFSAIHLRALVLVEKRCSPQIARARIDKLADIRIVG